MDAIVRLPSLCLLLETDCVLGLLTFGAFLVLVSRKYRPAPFPILNCHSWDMFQNKAKREFSSKAETLIREGLRKGHSAFQLVTSMGTLLILSDQYAEELRNDGRLGVYEAVKDVTLFDLPGFETMFQGSIHNHVITPAVNGMNKNLVQLTSSLSEEAAHCLQSQWTNNPDWHAVSVHETVLALTAQMTSRAFIGPELCRNPLWQDITINFTMNRAAAVQAIQRWPVVFHPIVHWFLPVCRDVRRQIQRAREILTPVLERDRRERHSRASSTDRQFSTLSFIDRFAKGRRYDATMAQLRLIGVSIHTTSDFVEKVLARICEHPKLVQVLRDEVMTVLKKGPLEHSSLKELTLMESVMKESQRLEPATLISMFRLAKETITLQDGTTISKGTTFAFANNLRLEYSMYPDPQIFDPYRFERMRQDPELAKLAPFTKTRSTHLAFGHGNHSCPGRFMACDETKLILCHMLCKYDFKWADGDAPELQTHGIFIQRDPKGMILVKQRREKIPL